MPGTGSEFSTEEWEKFSASLPIAVSDVLPVRIGDDDFLYLGLILRTTPFGEVRWCHIGGRQAIDETQAEAARRHLASSLVQRKANGKRKEIDPDLVPDRPEATFEFLREKRDGFGYDPRKHAVSACFRVWLPENVIARPGDDEALEFRWFRFDQLPDETELWPGTSGIIYQLTADNPDDLVAYEALNARQIGHNSLTWQTPALALTAQAFLLSIALGAQTAFASRIISSVLSLVIALLSVQLMTRHSAFELADARRLHSIELRRKMEPVHQRPLPVRGIGGFRSRRLWTIGLSLFGAAALVALGLTIFFPAALG